jgi:uncharacterized protein (PEP-CTERM system associated)
VNVNYAMQNLVYANSSSANTIRNQLSANAHAVLVEDLFFWDARGGIAQQNISPLGPQTSDNINDTGNRANVKTYTLSPYLRHRFGADAISELHYTHDGVSTNTALLNSNIDTALFKLDSGPSFKTLGWGFQYNDQKTNYGGSTAAVEMQSASANLSYRLTPRFSWTETFGYEKNDYTWSGGKPAGRFWMSGFSWAPTDRTSISASAGKRFYGTTYALSSSVRSRTTIWSLNYSEDITTAQAQLAGQSTVDQILTSLYPNDDLSTHQTRINDLINSNPQANLNSNSILPNSYFSNRVFLQKRLQGLASLNSGKSTFVLGGYYTVRTGQTTLAIDNGLYGTLSSLSDKTKEAGVNAQWNWKIYSRTTANIAADYIRVSAPTLGGKSDTKRVTLGLTKQMQPKLDGSIGYRHVLQKSSQIVGKVTEDAVYASLLMRF